MKNSQGFCLIPWFGIFIDSKSIGPCCVNYELSKSTDIESYLKSDELNNIKKEFLEGKKPISCNACWKAESVGVKSVRQEKSKLLIEEQKTLLKTYHHFSIRISNKCNYKCRMCHPRYSSAWQLDKKASSLIQGTTYTAEPFNLDNYKKNIEYIINVAKKQIVNINILGGEPLISEEFLYLLDRTEKVSVRNNIILNINTNLSVDKYKNIDYKKEFSTFNAVVLHASIDGLEFVGEYIRKGFKQAIFDKNLHYFKKYIKHLNVTLQLYNIYDIPKIYKYAKDNNIDIILNYLTSPKYLSVSLLDSVERDNILKFYKSIDFYNQNVEASLTNENVSLKEIDSFIKYTDGLDSIWKTDFKKSIPELSNWYKRIRNEKYNMV